MKAIQARIKSMAVAGQKKTKGAKIWKQQLHRLVTIPPNQEPEKNSKTGETMRECAVVNARGPICPVNRKVQLYLSFPSLSFPLLFPLLSSFPSLPFLSLPFPSLLFPLLWDGWRGTKHDRKVSYRQSFWENRTILSVMRARFFIIKESERKRKARNSLEIMSWKWKY